MVANDAEVMPIPENTPVIVLLGGRWRQATIRPSKDYSVPPDPPDGMREVIRYWIPLPKIAPYNPNCPYPESHCADCDCRGMGGDR